MTIEKLHVFGNRNIIVASAGSAIRVPVGGRTTSVGNGSLEDNGTAAPATYANLYVASGYTPISGAEWIGDGVSPDPVPRHFVARVCERRSLEDTGRVRRADRSGRRRYKPAIADHPLNELNLLVKIEWDADAEAFVTFVPQLNDISTYGKTEQSALDATAEMIVGHIEAAQSAGLALPRSKSEIREILSVLAHR